MWPDKIENCHILHAQFRISLVKEGFPSTFGILYYAYCEFEHILYSMKVGDFRCSQYVHDFHKLYLGSQKHRAESTTKTMFFHKIHVVLFINR